MRKFTNPIPDFLIRRGSEGQSFDLAARFGLEGASYSVTTSKGEAVAARIEDGHLIVEPGTALDYSDLVVTATLPGGETISDSIRVRVTGENAYTIAVFPDTQDYSGTPGAPIVREMAQWLIDQQESMNIVFMTHVGDVTGSATQAQWQNISDALSVLNGKLPYHLTAGNHDQSSGGSASDHTTPWMDEFYSPDKIAQNNPTFGGTYDMAPTRGTNNYHTFTAPDGTKWLSLGLEFGPSDDVVRWAKEVIESHLDHRVMLTTHAYMNWAGRHDATGGPYYGEGTGIDYGMGRLPEGANDGETLWRELVEPYPNVSFTFSGHIFGDGAETLVSYDAFGNPVHQMLVNYQYGVSNEIQQGNGGNGAMRLLTIDPENGKVYTSTYFAHQDRYMTNDRGEELDRDTLTGPYRGQEEVLELDLGAPQVHAIAKAGNDITADAGDGLTAGVTLGGKVLNPGALDTLVTWTDADGVLLATGPNPTVVLSAGRHYLTMNVQGPDGAVSRDTVLVTVTDKDTLLADNFNDGNADGWIVPAAPSANPLCTGSTEDFGIKGLPAAKDPEETEEETPVGPPVPVALVPAGSGTSALHLARAEGGALKNYTLAFDLLVPAATATGYIGLVQSSRDNGNDADMFLRLSGGALSVGTMSNYQGAIAPDSWARVVLSYRVEGGKVFIDRYIDGVSVGTIERDADPRYEFTDGGILLLTDEDGETAPVALSGVTLIEQALTAAEAAGLGKAQPGGIDLPEGSTGAKFVATPEGFELAEGAGSLAPQDGLELTLGTDHDLVKPMPVPVAPEEGGPSTPPESGVVAGVTKIAAMPQSQGLKVSLQEGTESGGPFSNWTLVFDVNMPNAGWMSLFQTDLTNRSDAEFFVNGAGAMGIAGSYHGAVKPGEWHRLAIVATSDGNQGYTFQKYIDGKLVGTTSWSSDRFEIDPAKGFLLFADEDGETRDVYVSSVGFTDKVLSAAEVSALGGVSAGGIFGQAPTKDSFELDFSGDTITDRFGRAEVGVVDVNASGTGNFIVKGSYADRVEGVEVEADAEGRVWEMSNTANNLMVWGAEEAKGWTDYRFEATLQSTDRDSIGAVFHYQDYQNYYRVSFNAGTSMRELVRVTDGVETVIASARAGMPWTRDVTLEIVVQGNEIRVFLDGKSVFGTITDEAPLGSGSVGLYSSQQKSSQFDDVFVGGLGLQARATAPTEAFAEQDASRATVLLDASDSYGANAIVSAKWYDAEGTLLGEGLTLETQLFANGRTPVTLVVTDEEGREARDTVWIDVVGAERVLFADDFSNADFQDRWTIVDEGEFGGVGEDGKLGDWSVEDGRLVQHSDVASRELKGTSASTSDKWNSGWSPLGDGINVLRRGTQVILNDENARDWTNYAVEATIETPDNGALGILVHYQDAQNYYKIELDAQSGTSFFQLIEVKDGVEKFLAQVPARYATNTAFRLRVEVVDNAIQAAIDGNAIFSYPIVSKAVEAGTVGLYSWGSAGLSFDDVRVVELPSKTDRDAASIIAAGDDRLLTLRDQALLVALSTLFANDTAGAVEGLRLHEVTEATGGTIEVTEDGYIRFTPDAGFTGTARFEYVVTNGAGRYDGAVVEIRVSAADAIVQANGSAPLFASAGVSTLFEGTTGRDEVHGHTGNDEFDGGAGDDYASGGAGQDQLSGGAGNDTLLGGAGDDTLDGGAGNDLLSGGLGDDHLYAGAGDDTLSGGAGNDHLYAGAGSNWMAGGAGDDTFHFAPGAGTSVITDFGNGADLIDLSAFADIGDFAALQARMTEIDGSVHIDLGQGTLIELQGQGLSSLDADDFRFA